MHHEHTGNCCGQSEHLDHEHLQQVMEQLGSLGCNGHRHHPEHQLMHSMFDEQQRLMDDDEDEVYVDENGVKRRRKASRFNIVHAMRLSKV